MCHFSNPKGQKAYSSKLARPKARKPYFGDEQNQIYTDTSCQIKE
jgi:hypothetical protein